MTDIHRIGQRESGRHQFICEASGDLSGRNILDIGCGFGWFERYALSSGCAGITGIEILPYLAERARREAPGANILQRDATGDLSDLGKFDTVCIFDFVEHLGRGEDVEMLSRLHGLLESGGRLMVSVPYRGFLATAFDPAFYFYHRHFRSSEIDSILKQAGFEATRFRFAGGAWEVMSMLWLYLFKWIFRREMLFADYIEGKRMEEYRDHRDRPSPGHNATMFVEAVKLGG